MYLYSPAQESAHFDPKLSKNTFSNALRTVYGSLKIKSPQSMASPALSGQIQGKAIIGQGNHDYK